MKYGELVQRAAGITWKHKSLWPFGIALAFFGGSVGSAGNGNGIQYTFGRQDLGRLGCIMPPNWEQIATAALALVAVLGIAVLILTIVGVLVRYTSIGALIGMTAEAERAGDVSFGTGLRRGWTTLIRVFLISLVVGIAAFLAVFVFVIIVIAAVALVALPAVPMFRAGGNWEYAGVAWIVLFGILLTTIVILAAIILTGAISLVKEYALRSAVLSDSQVFDAIGHGIAMVKTHLKESVWMWIVLGLIQMALGIVLMPLAIGIGGATLIPALALWRATETAVLPMLVALPVLIIGGLILVAIEGIYLTFQSVTWTLVYRELEPASEA
ncbi:MAG: hypothetical protein R6X16_13800 [Anaerolineae bacterium]